VTNAGGSNFYFGNRRGADGMFRSGCPYGTFRDVATNGITATATANERYEDLVEVWAREAYAAAMRRRIACRKRSQGHLPILDAAAVDEIKADPVAWLQLVAKKCWLTLWNREVPNNKDFAFSSRDISGCACCRCAGLCC